MFKEWSEVRVLARRRPGIGTIFAQHAVICCSVGMHLNTLLLVETAKWTVGGEGDGVIVVVTPLNRRPTSNTTSNNTSHSSGWSKGRIRPGTCVASGPRLWSSGLRSRASVSILAIGRRRSGVFPGARATARPRQEILRVLQLVLDVFEAASTNPLDELQLVTDFFQGGIPFETVLVLVGDNELWLALAMPEMWNEPAHKLIGNKTDHNGDGHRDCSQYQTDRPHRALGQAFDGECCATNKDDQDLTANNDDLNANKPFVAHDAFHDVEFVIDATRIVLVEDLHEDERVEDHRLHVTIIPAEDRSAGKVEDKRHNQLVD